ncbi:unnamed protein product, partial [Musa banksii]
MTSPSPPSSPALLLDDDMVSECGLEEIDTAGTGFKGRLVTHRRAMFWLVRRIHFDGMRGGMPMLRT